MKKLIAFVLLAPMYLYVELAGAECGLPPNPWICRPEPPSQQISCSSSEIYEDCFIASADVSIDLTEQTFVLIRNYTPLCPRWPPFGQIFGTVSGNRDQLKFYSEEGQLLGKLTQKMMGNGLFGKIMDYSFLDCKL